MYTIDELRQMLSGSAFDQRLKKLYRDGPDAQKSRIFAELDRFAATFGSDRQVLLFTAPGRSELSGNHTDHQHGRVLAAAVTLDVLAVVSPRSDTAIQIHSLGFSPCVLDIDNLERQDGEAGTSNSLVRGIAADLSGHGWQVGGFDACTVSSVPAGSGLSSSAAFETLVGTIFSHLYNQGRIDPLQIARTGQFAENIYFGKPCGLMDQTASATGDVVAIDFADPARPLVQTIACDFESMGFALFVVNAGGSHADLTDEYAAIPAEMKQVAACFGQSVLREVSPESFYAGLPALRSKVSDRAILRAMHFFEENERVDRQTRALIDRNMDEYLRLMQASGDSSALLLQNIYPSDNVKDRSVLLALAICRQLLAGQGAWRVHGGGFAGTVQALVPIGQEDRFTRAVEAVFGEGSCTRLAVRPAGGYLLSAGAVSCDD